MINVQIQRVNMLSEMVSEKLSDYQNDIEDYNKWVKLNPDRRPWECYMLDKRTSPTEIRRLMMVQRQEIMKLDKMLIGGTII